MSLSTLQTLRAARVGLAVAAWTGLLIGPMLLLRRLDGPSTRALGDRIGRLYLAGCIRLIGLAIERVGCPAAERPLLYVANHMSWLDIVVLGGLDDTRFVARHDMATWPVFGLFARLHRSVFVERRAARAAEGRDELMARLLTGETVTLFAEGTSSDGNRVLPFKSSFLAVAELYRGNRPLTLQPVSLAFTRLDGLPLGHDRRHWYAWVGDTPLPRHFWRVLGLGRATCRVIYHPPVVPAPGESRKTLSARLHAAIAAGVAQANAGR